MTRSGSENRTKWLADGINGEFRVGDELDGLNCVLKANKIVISKKDKHRRFN